MQSNQRKLRGAREFSPPREPPLGPSVAGQQTTERQLFPHRRYEGLSYSSDSESSEDPEKEEEEESEKEDDDPDNEVPLVARDLYDIVAK